jgi:ATP-dependent DNA helicase RecG
VTEPKPKLDARKMMELAVKVMSSSQCEHRDDGKILPAVGAVLRKVDGTVETACRGELRAGDHAEYEVLERKNFGSKLDGAVLFTTLEPCAPGARQDPKKSCAERVVSARVAEVWVGIEDPDPTVDRKGIKYLQDHNVTVHMFDRDLQEEIRLKNKAFIDQALERAAAAEAEPEKLVLSSLEAPSGVAAARDFSNEALEEYRKRARISDVVGSYAFNRRLMLQGLIEEAEGVARPTGFGLLLFGREPRVALPQAGLLATIRYPNGEDETRDFDGPAVLIPDVLEKWLDDKLPNIIDRSRMRREQVPALPFELVREAVVNALVHRDYGIVGGKCQLVVTEDTTTVRSPGGPIPPITLEQMQTFNAPMLSRNPQLHYVFARMELAEERGLGLRSMKKRAEKLGLPLPRYTFDDPYIVLTLYRSAEAVTRALPEVVLDHLSRDERAGWQYVASETVVSTAEYAKHMRFSGRQAQRHLMKFVSLGLLRRVGTGPRTEYHVVQS